MLAVLTHRFVGLGAEPSTDAASTDEAGIFRLVATLARSARRQRQRAVERHIGEFVERRGGRLTDDVERQIGQRFG